MEQSKSDRYASVVMGIFWTLVIGSAAAAFYGVFGPFFSTLSPDTILGSLSTTLTPPPLPLILGMVWGASILLGKPLLFKTMFRIGIISQPIMQYLAGPSIFTKPFGFLGNSNTICWVFAAITIAEIIFDWLHPKRIETVLPDITPWTWTKPRILRIIGLIALVVGYIAAFRAIFAYPEYSNLIQCGLAAPYILMLIIQHFKLRKTESSQS